MSFWSGTFAIGLVIVMVMGLILMEYKYLPTDLSTPSVKYSWIGAFMLVIGWQASAALISASKPDEAPSFPFSNLLNDPK